MPCADGRSRSGSGTLPDEAAMTVRRWVDAGNGVNGGEGPGAGELGGRGDTDVAAGGKRACRGEMS